MLAELIYLNTITTILVLKCDIFVRLLKYLLEYDIIIR